MTYNNFASTQLLRLSLDLEAITVLCRVYCSEHRNGKEEEKNQTKTRAPETADAAAVEFAR
jgi:hypothetical protein